MPESLDTGDMTPLLEANALRLRARLDAARGDQAQVDCAVSRSAAARSREFDLPLYVALHPARARASGSRLRAVPTRPSRCSPRPPRPSRGSRPCRGSNAPGARVQSPPARQQPRHVESDVTHAQVRWSCQANSFQPLGDDVDVADDHRWLCRRRSHTPDSKGRPPIVLRLPWCLGQIWMIDVREREADDSQALSPPSGGFQASSPHESEGSSRCSGAK